MIIEILVSTMNLENKNSFIKQLDNMNIQNNSLFINQVTQKDVKLFNINIGNSNKLLSFLEKGLSKSRNRAISNSTGDILVLADDDLCYEDNYAKTIEKAYEKYKDADIIAFVVKNNDVSRMKKEMKEGRVGFLKSLKLQSVQLTMKKKSLDDKKVLFDERFGAGSNFFMGEENIFLFDCLRKKMKIYYIPQKIATIIDNDSEWFKGFDSKYFISRGAGYYRMTKLFYHLFILRFAIQKKKLYQGRISIMDAVKFMYQGANELKRK